MVSPPVSGRITVNNGEAIREMAIAGLGLAMLPRFIVSTPLISGRLVRVMADVETRRLPIMAVWPAVEPMPAKLRALIDHLALRLSAERWGG